jgi:hypothetical protein
MYCDYPINHEPPERKPRGKWNWQALIVWAALTTLTALAWFSLGWVLAHAL